MVGNPYNLKGNIVPDASLPLRLPLAVLANHELQVRVAGAALAADPAVLELGKVALEEADLVLAADAGGVGVGPANRKMVPDLAAVDGRRGLRDQLDAPHVLPVPVRRRVERELGPLFGHRVVGVLERGPQVDVLVHRARAVDVVLVRADLVSPGPFLKNKRSY